MRLEMIAGTNEEREARRAFTILMTDDDENILHVVKEILTGEGFTVETFTNGYNTMRSVRSVGPSRVVLLCDFNMPDISGAEMVNRIRSDPATSSIPVVFMTGETDLTRLPSCTAYLKKPFQIDPLVGALDLAIRTARKGS